MKARDISLLYKYFAFINLFLCLCIPIAVKLCIPNFEKIIKFANYGWLTYYKPYDPKFVSFLLYI